MFDVGFSELALVGVIALIVVGPKRLPGLAREVGMWVGKIRRYADHVRREIEKDIRAAELKEMMPKPAVDDLAATVNEAKQILNETRRELDSQPAPDHRIASADELASSGAPADALEVSKPVEGTLKEGAVEAGELIPGTDSAPKGSTDVSLGPPRPAETATNDDEQRRAAQ